VRGAAFHEPHLEWWSIAWRLIVAPWPVTWLLFIPNQIRLTDTLLSFVAAFSTSMFLNAWLSVIALVAGLPLYLFYRRLGWSSWWLYALGAALIGTLILALFALLPSATVTSYSYFSNATGSCDAIVDGVRTACGWMSVFVTMGFVAVFGAASGVAFWALLRWRRRSGPRPSNSSLIG
jgi:hypothetical protein